MGSGGVNHAVYKRKCMTSVCVNSILCDILFGEHYSNFYLIKASSAYSWTLMSFLMCLKGFEMIQRLRTSSFIMTLLEVKIFGQGLPFSLFTYPGFTFSLPPQAPQSPDQLQLALISAQLQQTSFTVHYGNFLRSSL